MPTTIDLDAAAELTRTGDLWLFRGESPADRAIRGGHERTGEPRLVGSPKALAVR